MASNDEWQQRQFFPCHNNNSYLICQQYNLALGSAESRVQKTVYDFVAKEKKFQNMTLEKFNQLSDQEISEYSLWYVKEKNMGRSPRQQ